MSSNLKANTPPRAVILGIAGTTLTDGEKALFEQTNPVGFILFGWNLESYAQVKTLIQSLKNAVQREDVLILMDVEGGKVNRLAKLGHTWPAPAFFEALDDGPQACFKAYQDIGRTLTQLGVNVDCAPSLDVRVPGAHEVIGSRSFSASPTQVAALGKAAIQGLLEAVICPVIKHIPGHGPATQDSHETLPVVDLPLEQLEDHFFPFQQMVDLFPTYPFMGMTAHIVYKALDPDSPATLSRRVIQDIIRGKIGFKGILMSDDLDMKAISGPPGEKVQGVLQAGCDLALYGKGDLATLTQAALSAPPLKDTPLTHLEAFFRIRAK